jgi:YD repeat-containing protein
MQSTQGISHARRRAGARSGFQWTALIGTVALFIAAAAHAQGLPPPPVSPTPVTTYEYDAQGNRTKITRGAGTLNLETRFSYDPLYRVKDHTDPKSGKTSFEYDGGDRTTKVTDPRNLVTQYPRDGFGNATQLISPDTGRASHTFNEIGNPLTRTDSRGVLTSYSYDAADRPTGAVSTLSGQPSESVTWTYSQTGPGFAYGIGRLTSTAHPAGSSQYRYEGRGRVVSDTQRVLEATGANTAQLTHVVAYGYTLGDLSSTTYPSGRVASLTLLRGRVQAVSLAKDASSTAVALITGVRWEPFEWAVSSWQWNTAGGPLPHERFYDLSGRITRYRLGPAYRDVRYDEASRITSFTHLLPDGTPQPALDQAFTHDENDRSPASRRPRRAGRSPTIPAATAQA